LNPTDNGTQFQSSTRIAGHSGDWGNSSLSPNPIPTFLPAQMHGIHGRNIESLHDRFELLHTPALSESHSMVNHQFTKQNNQPQNHANPHYSYEHLNSQNSHAMVNHQLPIQYYQMQSNVNSHYNSDLLNAPALSKSQEVANNQLPTRTYEMTIYPKDTPGKV